MILELPDEDALRETTSYTDIFMLTILYNVGFYGIFVFAFFLLFLVIKLYKRRLEKLQNNFKRESLLTYHSQSRQSATIKNMDVGNDPSSNDQDPNQSEPRINEKQELEIEAKEDKWKITPFDVINFLTSLFFYGVLVTLSLLYFSVYIFGLLGKGTSHDIMAVAVMVGIVLLPTIIWKVYTRVKSVGKKQIIITAVFIGLWIIASIVMLYLLKGVCVCAFNKNYGIQFKGIFYFSTEYTRSQQIKQVCEPKQVCHLYATLPEDTSTSVIINAHTGINVESLNITLQAGDQSFTKVQNATVSLNNVEQIAQRNIFSIYFSDLTPNTYYNITLTDAETQLILNKTNYLTLPDRDAEEIRFAVGGDIGLDQEAITLTSHLVDYDPHVILLGGDIAYDDGMESCFYSWDNFYDIFDGLNKNLTRLVPFVMSVGNHDVGFDALAKVNSEYTSTDDTPYYFIYNPQEVIKNVIPKYNERSSYHRHIIGPTVQAHLDSGYINSYKSQKDFIENINTQFKNYYKFANYHNPLYPSCTNSEPNSNDVNVISNGTTYWTEYFDKGAYTAIFEHHTHHRKFTKKIKEDKPVDQTQEGVRYVGDGSWGVPEGGCGESRRTKRPEYFEYMDPKGIKDTNHIWLITLSRRSPSSHQLNYTAIDIENKVVFNTTDSLILP